MTTKRQRENSQFQTGSGAYDCVICGKKTRDTGHGEDCAEMCRVCFDAAGQVNYLNDNFDGELFRQLFGSDPSGYMETPLCKTPEEVVARSAAAAERLESLSTLADLDRPVARRISFMRAVRSQTTEAGRELLKRMTWNDVQGFYEDFITAESSILSIAVRLDEMAEEVARVDHARDAHAT